MDPMSNFLFLIGTGLQSYLEYDWKVGDTYELIINVRQDAQDKEKAVYTAWFRLPEKSIWRMLSSLQVSGRSTSGEELRLFIRLGFPSVRQNESGGSLLFHRRLGW